MRKLSETQIIEGRWIAEHGWFAAIPARTAAAMVKAGYIVDSKASDSGPVWRFTPEGLYAWAKQAPAWAVRNISTSYIEDAEREAYRMNAARTMHVRTEGATVTMCGQDAMAVGATPIASLVTCPDCCEHRSVWSYKVVSSDESIDGTHIDTAPCAQCGTPVHRIDSMALRALLPSDSETAFNPWIPVTEPLDAQRVVSAKALASDPTHPYLNDFEDGCDEQPRCAFCTNTYDECTCEYPPASVALERKLAERRATGGATFEQRAEIVRLAASRNVPAALEPVVTAATAVDGVLAYEDAQDAIGRLLRVRGQVHIGNKIDAYKRQTGRPILTPKQARRLNKKLRRDLVHPR